jgi:hypothetical protein
MKEKPTGYRSKVYGVEVVRNKEGWHINLSLDRTPYTHYGPFEEEMTIPRAMKYLSTMLVIEGET